MRRHNRSGGGPTVHANRANGAAFPDSMLLIRSYDSDSNPTRPMRPSPLTASTIQGLPLDLLDRLRSFPLFASAPDSFLAAIGGHLRPQVYATHDYILTEGDDAKAMYWLVRGSVRVASRDGESTYAELKPGAFFGEIGVLMDVPRTATIMANMRSLVVRLNKEDLKKELPNYPDVERVILEEAKERLAILERKKKELGHSSLSPPGQSLRRNGKRTRDRLDGDVVMGESGMLRDGEVLMNKKRKSPSPSLADAVAASALGSGSVNIRQLLRELPLFSSLPPEILHFLGLNAHPRSYPPFTDIIRQGSQGRGVFFIVRGEVEVVAEKNEENDEAVKNAAGKTVHTRYQVKARLGPGQYFGEVTSLALAPRRTATVRTISSVECLMIGGDVLNEFWRRCSPDLRQQVEDVAKQRLQSAIDNDIPMTDVSDNTPAISELMIADIRPRTPRKRSVPTVTFSNGTSEAPSTPSRQNDKWMIEPLDPDPFLNPDLDNVRARSRRGSLAPPTPSTSTPESPQTPASMSEESSKSPSPNRHMSPSPINAKHMSTPPSHSLPKRPKVARRPSRFGKGVLPDTVLVQVFKYLDICELMKMRLVSMHWMKVLTNSQDILHVLDLSSHNRRITDRVLVDIICPFVGNRPRLIDLSNCFHVTDEGFAAIATSCGENVKVWKMKSVWDITGQAVLEMVNRARGLQEVDLSNCRKVGDNLLARVIGWVVPDLPPAYLQHHQQQLQAKGGRNGHRQSGSQQAQQQPQQLPPGTVVGCPRLKRLTLSYCKHVTDRSMAHIALHASSRLESIDLTRCTSITDSGFQHWSVYPFPLLRKLCLADCTYLTDNAIVYLTNAAKMLRELDLSFCCALSDTATEVLALQLPHLRRLSLAFCGSAVSDSSLRAIGLHLLELRALSVRGCVRVTGQGVEAVTDGCSELNEFDISQCKNLDKWLQSGGIQRVNRERTASFVGGRRGSKGSGPVIRWCTVADGSWRVR